MSPDDLLDRTLFEAVPDLQPQEEMRQRLQMAAEQGSGLKRCVVTLRLDGETQQHDVHGAVLPPRIDRSYRVMLRFSRRQ